jgi:hypothetical protein
MVDLAESGAVAFGRMLGKLPSGQRPGRGYAVDQIDDMHLSSSSSEVAVRCELTNSVRAALLGALVVNAFPHGTVHEAREDLQAALRSDPKVFSLWKSLTPLGRNEFICWVDDAKQSTTRQRRIERTCDELLEGKKRPCCWAGCIHRTNKAPSRWQQTVLIDKKGTNSS